MKVEWAAAYGRKWRRASKALQAASLSRKAVKAYGPDPEVTHGVEDPREPAPVDR